MRRSWCLLAVAFACGCGEKPKERPAPPPPLVAVTAAVAKDVPVYLDEIAKVNLDYCFIRSPIDGRAGRRLVDAGNLVTAGSDAPMLVIERLDPMYAGFSITERDLPEVRRQMAGGTLTAQVSVPDDPK